MAAVALVGTLDTKGPDFAFLAERLRAAGDRGHAVTALGRGAASVVADLVAEGRVAGVLGAVNPDILVLCHGGPIAEPGDVAQVLSRTTGVCGFFGASSMERLPTERALTAQVRAFTELSVS